MNLIIADAFSGCWFQYEVPDQPCDHELEPLIDLSDVITLRCRICGGEIASE